MLPRREFAALLPAEDLHPQDSTDPVVPSHSRQVREVFRQLRKVGSDFGERYPRRAATSARLELDHSPSYMFCLARKALPSVDIHSPPYLAVPAFVDFSENSFQPPYSASIRDRGFPD